MKKFAKIALIVASFVLVAALSVGGTLAWLQASTTTVVNTFTPSDIGVKLEETKNDFKMTPGVDIAKDPKVTIVNDVDAYLFVKIDKSENYDTYLEEYDVADGWTKLEDGVYYREVATNADPKAFDVLEGNKVTVKTSVTNVEMDLIDGLDAAGNAVQAEIVARPTLTFKAYAIQKANGTGTIFKPADAWAQVKDMADNSFVPGTPTT